MSTLLWVGIVFAGVVILGVVLVYLWFRMRPILSGGVTKPMGASPQPRIDKNVQFTVYRPATIVPEKEYTLLAFAHLTKRRADAPQSEPDPVAEVQRLATKILSDQPARYEPAKLDRGFSVPQKGWLLFVPIIEGCTFNPPTQTVQWLNSVQKVEFGMTASAAVDGREVEGQMTVYLGTTYLTEIPIRITVDSKFVIPESQQGVLEETSAEPYRKIFASYSRKDTQIVEDFEAYVQALGDEYLRDVKNIRAGEVWSKKLEELIRDASVFQLFWSSNSMTSEFVKQEWEYALALNREKFIRPVYWENPRPEKKPDLPPPDLDRLEFYKFPTVAEQTRGVIPPVIQKPDGKSDTETGLESSSTGLSRYCTRCGASNDATAQYCLICQAALSPVGGYQPMQSAHSQGSPPRPLSTYPIWILPVVAALTLVLAAVAIYIGYRIIWADPDQPPPNLASPSPTPTATVGALGVSPAPGVSPSPTLSPSPNQTASPSPSLGPSPAKPTPSPDASTPTPTPAPTKRTRVEVRLGEPPTFIKQFQEGTYLVVVTNLGPNAITDVEVTELLPKDLAYVSSTPSVAPEGRKIVWNFKEIAAGDGRKPSVTVRLRRALKRGEKYTPTQRTTVKYTDSEGKRQTVLPG